MRWEDSLEGGLCGFRGVSCTAGYDLWSYCHSLCVGACGGDGGVCQRVCRPGAVYAEGGSVEIHLVVSRRRLDDYLQL